MRRSSPVLVAVLGAAFLFSACGSGPGAAAAAKVATTRILRSDLNDQLEVLSKNTKWLDSIASDFGKKSLAEPNGNVSTALSAAWLTALMNQAVVDQAFEAKDLKVSDQNRKNAKASADQLFNTDQGQTFDTMPKWFRDDFVAGQARYEAVKTTVPGDPPATDAELESLFAQVKQQYCPSGNAVLHILSSSREGADRVEAALAAGQDFPTLAGRSEDSGTARAGGFLTCTGSPNFSQLPEAFRQAIAQVPVGGTSPPIQSDSGWHVVRIVPFDLPNVRPFVAAVFEGSRRPPMTQFISQRLRKANVWVDPRYGTLTRGTVQPPRAPRTRSEPPTTATTQPGS